MTWKKMHKHSLVIIISLLISSKMLELFRDSNKGSWLSYLPVKLQTCNWKVFFGEENLLKNTFSIPQILHPFSTREKKKKILLLCANFLPRTLAKLCPLKVKLKHKKHCLFQNLQLSVPNNCPHFNQNFRLVERKNYLAWYNSTNQWSWKPSKLKHDHYP